MSLKSSANLIIRSFFSHVADYLVVRYPQRTIEPSRGSSAKLSCEANYDFKKCGVVHVVWHKLEENSELTNPDQYLTTVNETISDYNWRRRQVVTEIMSVAKRDDGRYQCKATCESGEQAMGHFITINVKIRTDGLSTSLWSGRKIKQFLGGILNKKSSTIIYLITKSQSCLTWLGKSFWVDFQLSVD
uniref:Ig-like domain-containing protein n=1 Tax=Poecilia reticulata TaxID=8081 RepID=A0A3P9Q2A6_POERE